MSTAHAVVEFTGEFFVPGRSNERMAADHLERYRFACQFAQGKSILDIACGEGYGSQLLCDAGARQYVGVDINEQLVDHAKQAYISEHISYCVGDICTYTSDTPFDVITCFETIEHVADYDDALRNLAALLCPGGVLLISSPNRPVTSPDSTSLDSKPANPYHTQEFVPDELIECLRRQGFEVGTQDVYGQRQRREFSLAPLNAVVRLALGNPKKKASPVVEPLRNRTPRYFLVVARKT